MSQPPVPVRRPLRHPFARISAVIALLAFAAIAVWVFNQGERLPVNLAVANWFSLHERPGVTAIVKDLTELGSVSVTHGVGAVAFGCLIYRQRLLNAGRIAAALLGGDLFLYLLKQSFHEPRPAIYPAIAVEHGYSFPSGHALLSTCLYGFILALIVSANPRQAWRWVVVVLGILLILTIMASRLYLEVHWLTDVLAGACFGYAWMTVCWLTGRRPRHEVSKPAS